MALGPAALPLPLDHGGGTDHSSPMKGYHICCTSVPDEQRTRIAEYAVQMGAVHRYDLTPDATHLIVGDYKTPKYQYVARERPDVRPMTPAWVEAIRELWISDQDIDMDALDAQYTLPIFHSLRFSMTGCDDADQRAEIAELVKANGAAYEGDLTKSITHLISFRTEGAKYRAAKAWRLQIVPIAWFQDCLERGMILEERFYDMALPVEERGIGAWDRSKSKTPRSKRRREAEAEPADTGKRKLRRTASTKLTSQNDRIWGDIVGGGSIMQVARSGTWGPDAEETWPTTETKLAESGAGIPSIQPAERKKLGIFGGCQFCLHHFPPSRREILASHLVAADGDIVQAVEDLTPLPSGDMSRKLFIVVPHDLPVSNHPVPPDSSIPVKTVTLWWVERCLHYKKFLDPAESVVGRPFPVFPISGFQDLLISSSGFTGIDLLHFTKAVQLIGAEYSEDMTQKSSMLVTRSLSALRQDKFDFAHAWNVPIVTAEWLWDSIVAGTMLPMGSKYRCRSQKQVDSIPTNGAKASPKALVRLERSEGKLSTTTSNTTAPVKFIAKAVPDKSASKANDVPSIKTEDDETRALPSPASTSAATPQSSPHRLEPLAERDVNLSPSRTLSAHSDHPTPRVEDDINHAISNLLAKTKGATTQSSHPEACEPRKRTGRILGRVASNLSAGSGIHSRATSVDSTATHGNPVEYPIGHPKYPDLKATTVNEHIELLMKGTLNADGEKQTSCSPPATQLGYHDPDSTEAREVLMARLKGESIDLQQRRRGLEKSVTMGDIMEKGRSTRRSGRLGR